MGYKTKSMINQASGLDVNYKLKQELNKYTDFNPKKNKVSTTNKQTPQVGGSGFGDRKGGFGNKIIPTSFNGKITTTSNLLPTSSPKENPDKKQSDKAYKKQAKSIGTYINEGGERGYKKSQRKEARAVGKEAAKDIDTSFKKAELAGTDFNSLLIGTMQNLGASAAASSKKRKVKKAAKKEHKEFQKKGSSNFDGKGLTEGFKGADLPKIDSGIKTGDFFQDTFVKFNPDRDKVIKKGAQKPENVVKNNAQVIIDPTLAKNIQLFSPNPNQATKVKGKTKDQYDVNPPSYLDRTIQKVKKATGDWIREDFPNFSFDKLPTPREVFGFQMTGDGFNKGMLRKNKYKK